VVLEFSCYPHKFDFSVNYSAELSSFTEILDFLHSQLSTAVGYEMCLCNVESEEAY
jgi:hypothetical protein